MTSIDSKLFEELREKYAIDNDVEIEILNELLNQNWMKVLQHNCVPLLLQSSLNASIGDTNAAIISSSDLNITDDKANRLLFYVGIACLQLFVCDNFIAFIECTDFDDCRKKISALFDCGSYDALNVDGERLYDVIRSEIFLKLSHFAFTATKLALTDVQLVFCLWRLRFAAIHQICLSSLSDTIFNEIISYSKIILKCIEEENDRKLSNETRIELYNEIVATFIVFGDVEQSKYSLNGALKLSELNITLSGALGVKTQFQQKPVSQLVVKVEKKSNESDINESKTDRQSKLVCKFPKNIALNDDTLLPNVKFLSLNLNESVFLSKEEQSLILLIIKLEFRTGSSSDELLNEELLSYLDFLIKNNDIWVIHCQSLLLRSLLEKNSSRRVERSMTQINELVDAMRQTKYDINQVKLRYNQIYSVLLQPFWIIEKYLADIYVSLGVYKSALEIYIRLQLWDDVIKCYQRLARRDKAEAIIRERLLIEETPYLYCLLGDTTDNIEHYHKAWSLSNSTYPRAQKSLGNYYFAKKQFNDCIPYFKRSLELNSMQIDVWYRLAFAALILEDYELSAAAYRRVVQFETNSFEAWNNLSKAYIKSNQKYRAWKTLQEALKCSYDEWRIWENYIAVCIDVGAFAETIEAWHRLIDLKSKYEDEQIAELLVNSIRNQTLDINGESAAILSTKAQQLFGRIAATSSGTSKFWRCYARLLLFNKVSDVDKVTRCLANCHRILIQNDNWFKNIDTAIDVLKHCLLLSEEYFECLPIDESKTSQILFSCKSALNSVLVTLEKNKYIRENSDRNDEIDILIKSCETKLSDVIHKLQN